MADYKTIHGTLVRSYTTDPDNPIEGQVWYDKTNKVLQFQVPNITTAGAWRTGGNLNTVKTDHAAAGIYTAALAFGGENAGGLTATNEQYNGGSWTEVGDLNAARYSVRGGGTYTSALAVGVANYPFTGVTESWNGSSWTEVADLNTARGEKGAAATDNTNSIVYGGRSNPSSSNVVDDTESWNGSSWTEVADLKKERKILGCAGAIT